ncbi:hypothetical protein A8U91_02055 [Halomonas elongata]|uniref:Uncharacterized protein n=1 Tax=Halomonas elongata TaxID=2746 RepID=A0A1B8P5Y9_HALEL|nr:hypothetical protein [Halomonas elongata]OBX37677.1 hypothetical protein A8U91_02055 [Halomonas elongata]
MRPWSLVACIGLLMASVSDVVDAEPLVVEAALDRRVVAPLLEAFEQSHPDIELVFHDRSTLEVDTLVERADPARTW